MPRVTGEQARPAAGEKSTSVVTPHDVVDPTQLPPLVTITSLLAAGGVAAGVSLGVGPAVVVVGLLGVLASVGWVVLLDVPSPRSAAAVLAVGAAAVAATVGLTAGEPMLRWLPATVAVGMILAFVQQLVRRDGRRRLTSGVAGTVAGLALTTCGVTIVPLAARPLGPAFVATAMAALAVGAVVELLARHPRVGAWAVLPVLVCGAVTAGVVGSATAGLNPMTSIGLGMLVASLSYSTRRVLAAVPVCARLRSAQLTAASAAVFVTCPVGYALALLAGI